VYELCDHTITCPQCHKRMMIDAALPNIDYCKCSRKAHCLEKGTLLFFLELLYFCDNKVDVLETRHEFWKPFQMKSSGMPLELQDWWNGLFSLQGNGYISVMCYYNVYYWISLKSFFIGIVYSRWTNCTEHFLSNPEHHHVGERGQRWNPFLCLCYSVKKVCPVFLVEKCDFILIIYIYTWNFPVKSDLLMSVISEERLRARVCGVWVCVCE
jgi:hypothetical protein